MSEVNLKSARTFGELTEHMKNVRQTIKVTAGFVLQGRKPAEIGEVIEVSRALAADLIASGKAVVIDPPKPKAEAEPDKPKGK